MRPWIWIGLSFLVFSAAHADAPDRVALDRDAKAQFLGLNFFDQGRGMHMSPGLVTYVNEAMQKLPSPDDRNVDLRTWFTRRWGLQFEGKNIVGLFDRDYERLHVGAIGCVACHSGRAAGQLVVGLGNKNIDVLRMAKDVHELETWWKALVPAEKKSDAYADVEDDALKFSQYLSNEDIGNLTQGLVPVSFIRGWFYRTHGDTLPGGIRRGQVKVPFLWGYGEKKKIGQFCDGYGDGTLVGWAVAVELTAGQSPEVVRSYVPKVEAAEQLFSSFLPPKYPFAVDHALAAKGQQLFNRTCAGCHGTYETDADGLPIYKAPKFIPWAVVRTDDDRLLGNTPAFDQRVETSPLRDLIRHNTLGPGYFAPRLVGVWSRFPFLHNGSVPSVAALLTRPEDRPNVWSLHNAGERARFDEDHLGLTIPESTLEREALLVEAKLGKRDVYFTGRDGHSNQGHDFYTSLGDDDKRSLIEYLKTL